MHIRTAIAAAAAMTLVACGDGAEAPRNSAEAAPDVPMGSDAELAADAALADEAARAEAEDAAIGGNVSPSDVEAAGNVAQIAQNAQ